jgi:hypothetical protein
MEKQFMNSIAQLYPLRPVQALSATQKQLNCESTRRMVMFERGDGLYAFRDDVGIDREGFIQVPCCLCRSVVRVSIDIDYDDEILCTREFPVAHSDDEGAEFEADLVTCKYCVLVESAVAA